jgi:hypothetical protein
MKTPCFVVAIGVCVLAGWPVFAGSQPQPSVPDPHWNIRAELLIVDMPQAKALALLPALRGPAKIDGAVTQIMAAIDHSEATLIGYPVVQVVDGQAGNAEPISEKRYPTEFEPPLESGTGVNAVPLEFRYVSWPTAFETRNTGLTFVVTPRVLQNGNWIFLNIVSSRVILMGFDSYITGIKQPKFVSLRTETTLAVQNGQRTLLAFHLIPETDSQVELSILQASATPIK